MKLKIKEPFGKLDKNQLSNFESTLGKKLPSEYSAFLLNSNGGRPTPNNFKTVNGEYESDIQFFYGVTNGNYGLENNRNIFNDRISEKFVPIANDSLGNLILLELNSGSIYFYDHEIEEEFLVADRFSTFINSLYNVKEDRTELDIAISSQNISFFEKLIKQGRQIVEIVNEFNQPIIIVAALRNKLKLVRFFVERGADKTGALFAAASNGHFETIEYLISIGCNVNERDAGQNNDTALIQASFGGFLDVVKVLIDNGADINAVDDHGQTALNKAYWSNNDELVNYMEQVTKTS